MPQAEKEAWAARAKSDNARYLHELPNYGPPPGYDVQGDAIASVVPSTGTRRGSQSQHDPNALKRNMSSYLMYQNCMREQF